MSRTKLPVKCLDTPTHSLPAGIVIKPLNELLLCLDSSSTLRFYQTTFETIFEGAVMFADQWMLDYNSISVM